MAEVKDTSKPKKQSTKPRHYKRSAQDILSWASAHIQQHDIERMIQEMMDWVETEEAWDFLGFYGIYGYPRSTFDKWLNAYPKLREVYEYVRLKLAEKRQRYATFKKYGADPVTIHKTLHHYHPEWKHDHDEEHALKVKKLELQEKETKATQSAMAFFGLGMKKNETDIPG